METLRRLHRLPRLALHLLLGVLLNLLYLRHVRDGIPDRRFRRLRRWWLRGVCRHLGLDVRVHGTALASPALWVANHVSWLDIPVVGGQAEVGFLSKAEVRRWPVIGWLAAHSGTLFIQRGRHTARHVAELIARHIRAGHSVLVFPEARTTRGDEVRRFYPRLFAPAVEHGLPVQPVAIRYLDRHGRPDPAVPFVGEQSFLGNLWRVAGRPRLRVELHFLPPLAGDGFGERRALAEAAERAVRAAVTGAPQPASSAAGGSGGSATQGQRNTR